MNVYPQTCLLSISGQFGFYEDNIKTEESKFDGKDTSFSHEYCHTSEISCLLLDTIS